VSAHRWNGAPPLGELGAVVHGPFVLGRGTGVAVAARCVFAHPGGLHLPIVMIASGVHAEAAQRQSGHEHRLPGHEPSPSPGWSYLELRAEVNGRAGELLAFAATSASGEDRYVQEGDYWIEELPADGTLRLTAAWPQVGLPPSATTLTLAGLPEAARQAISLGDAGAP
jgi:hypothetical protein